MAEEKQEIVAAILAAGLVASGKLAIAAVMPTDTPMVVSLYHDCLEELQKTD